MWDEREKSGTFAERTISCWQKGLGMVRAMTCDIVEGDRVYVRGKPDRRAYESMR